ncbi:MAG TPA: hypothetical protein P5262_04795 [Candidatus Moranbacteria bacterium]|nr:hypothetical protein [Candidatus Moranbacteria bacterium]
MFLKLRSLLFSLIFLIGLELIVLFHRHVFVVAFFLIFLSIYFGKKSGGKWKHSILPAFFTVSSISLLYLVGLFYEQQIFIVLVSLMYYLSLLGAFRLGQYEGDKTAKGMIMASAISTIFFTYAGAYGLYLNFLVPLYALMAVYAIATLLVSFQYFSLVYLQKSDSHPKTTVWVYSFILALIMAEIIWTMNYWPFGYLTTGVIALILYYMIWDITQCYFQDILSKKRVASNAVLVAFLVGFVLMSAKWIPVI